MIAFSSINSKFTHNKQTISSEFYVKTLRRVIQQYPHIYQIPNNIKTNKPIISLEKFLCPILYILFSRLHTAAN